MSNKVTSRTSLYNPLLQKPIALHPIGPGSYPAGYGGYVYVGPPPDFGGTYGKFQDTAGREQVGIKSSKMFSIHDGSPTQFQAELSPEERDALLSQMDHAMETHRCEHCRSELAVTATKKMDKVFCPHCGSEMAGAAEKVKQCVSKMQERQENEMGTEASAVEAKAKKAKGAMHPSDAEVGDAAKEAMKKGHPDQSIDKDLGKEGAKKEAPGAAGQKFEPKGAQMKEPSLKVEKIDPMKELGKDLVKADAEDAKAKKRERLKASIKAYRARRAKQTKANAPEVDQAAAPAPAVETAAPVQAATKAKLRRELRIMAALEPKRFAQVKKHPKLSAICAEVEGKVVSKADRIKVRAELAVLASEDAMAHDELCKQLDFIAPEILMEEKMGDDLEGKEGHGGHEHGDNVIDDKLESHKDEKDEACGMESAKDPEDDFEKKAEKESEELKSEDKAAKAEVQTENLAPAAAASDEKKEDGKEEGKEGEDDKTEAMEHEFLASLDSLKGEKIEMSLYNETAENPFWNVTVDGEPVGRIHLADQPEPQDIRAAFCNESYAENFGNAVRSVGLKKLLTLTRAKLFAHRLDDAEVTARLRDKAKAEAKAEMEEKMQTIRKDLMSAMSIAMVAADKNFYQEEAGHSLKAGLWNAIVQAGLTDESAVWAVEAGFEHAPEYFQFIMAKAQEIMDMPKEARQEIQKQILGSGKIEIKAAEPTEESLQARLVKSSVNVIAMGGQVSGENRAEIANQLGLSAYRK